MAGGASERLVPESLRIALSGEVDATAATFVADAPAGDDLAAMATLIEASGYRFESGPYVSDEPQVFAEIVRAGETWSTGLGLDGRTLSLLERLAAMAADGAAFAPLLRRLAAIRDKRAP